MTDNPELRQKAKTLALEKATPENIESMSPAEVRQILHELRAHQIELEMQNEELRAAREALDISHARYRDLYDFAPAGYITLSEQGVILEANLAAAALLGEPRSNLVKRPLSGFIRKEDQDISYRHRKQLFDSGEPRECELQMVKKDGSLFWALLDAIAAKDPAGEPTCRVVLSDITRRRQAEKELLFKEDIIKSSSCAIATCDLQGNMTYGNPFFQKQWGFDTPEEFLGAPFQKFWRIEDQYETIMKTLQSKGIWAGELKGIRKDGSLFDTHVSAAAVLDDTGTPMALTSTSMDITERKWAEQVLNESDEQRRLFLEHVPNLAIQGYTSDGTTIYWNHASETLYGYPASEAIGKSLFDLIIPPEMKTAVQSAIRRMMETGEPIPSGELSLKRKDGSCVSVYSGHAMARIPGKEPQFFCMDFDLTERKATEARYQHLQKAESLGRMAGAIAHHFNNQLSVVIGNLELVLMDLPSDAKNRENLLRAMIAAYKATEVSRQMLIYLGQTSGKHEPVDLSGVCRQSLSLLQAAIPKGMTLKADLPDSGPVILADAGQIQQVLANLITNAGESISNDQGTISLAVGTVIQEKIPALKRFPIDWQPKSMPHACLEVSDTGCGISHQDIEKLFDPFFTTKFTGRGMGLAVIRGIVKTHGGCITVDSQPGYGSVFRVFLPVSMEKIPLPPEQEKPAAVLAREVETGGTVLLIEDEEMVRNMAKTMLTRFGYTVIEAQDGMEALEIFQQHRNEICCILSDLTMPCMGGWEILTALRKMRADVPVVLASGHSKDVVMAGDHPELPQAFLYKPYSMSELKEALAKAMGL